MMLPTPDPVSGKDPPGESHRDTGQCPKRDRLAACSQYPNGGWPQCWPDFVHTTNRRQSGLKVSRRNPEGLTRFVTFNDDVMTGALRCWTQPPFPAGVRVCGQWPPRKAADAVAKGVECILRCQVRVGVS